MLFLAFLVLNKCARKKKREISGKGSLILLLFFFLKNPQLLPSFSYVNFEPNLNEGG